jgi:hypothetical protein
MRHSRKPPLQGEAVAHERDRWGRRRTLRRAPPPRTPPRPSEPAIGPATSGRTRWAVDPPPAGEGEAKAGLRLLLQGRNDLVWIESKNSRERHEFHDRDSPLSTFEAGDEGPRFSQAGRKIGLRHCRRLSPCDEEADQGFVTFRSAWFCQFRPRQAKDGVRHKPGAGLS